jgi:uncharacterized protein YcbX
MSHASWELGQVNRILRYPVKSMKGEALEESTLAWNGLVGDRSFGFCEVKSGGWLTAREFPRLILYEPRYTDPLNTDSPIVVTTPHGRNSQSATG